MTVNATHKELIRDHMAARNVNYTTAKRAVDLQYTLGGLSIQRHVALVGIGAPGALTGMVVEAEKRQISHNFAVQDGSEHFALEIRECFHRTFGARRADVALHLMLVRGFPTMNQDSISRRIDAMIKNVKRLPLRMIIAVDTEGEIPEWARTHFVVVKI